MGYNFLELGNQERGLTNYQNVYDEFIMHRKRVPWIGLPLIQKLISKMKKLMRNFSINGRNFLERGAQKHLD